MKISYIGHACFLVESDSGVRVLMDPYEPQAFDGAVDLQPFQEKVDCITSSHDHFDHFHMDEAFGDPLVFQGPGEGCGITFDAVTLPHGTPDGESRGMVQGFRFEMDSIAIFHPGDTGRILTPEEVQQVGRVDVLLVPVGGHFTIGPKEAIQLIEQLQPSIVIPMHFQSDWIHFPIATLPQFLTRWGKPWEEIQKQPLHLSRNTLPPPVRMITLRPTHTAT